MIEREYLKEVMFILNREFDINLTMNEVKDNQKINLWYEVLKHYPKHILDQAVLDLVATHEYKEVRCSHLNVACIRAIEKPALEFGKKLVEIVDENISEYRIKPVVEEEFGELGLKIYESNKEWLLYYNTADRDKLIKSMSEIYKNKLWIAFNKQKLIEDTKKHLEYING